MRINIKATGMELTPAISDYAAKKVSSLEKYIKKDAVAQVEVGRSTQHHKKGEVFRAEVRITGAGLDLYAASEEADLYASIDMVKDELKETLLQLKGKRETLTRRGAQAIKNMMKGFNIFKRRE